MVNVDSLREWLRMFAESDMVYIDEDGLRMVVETPTEIHEFDIGGKSED